VAAHQLMIAAALRERLPRVAEVFAAGQICYRLVNAIVYRTALITDADAAAKVDTELAAAVIGWGSLSVAKADTAIDYWVDRYDPNALRRVQLGSQGRHLDVSDDPDGTGMSWLEGRLFSHDATALDQRLDAMARAVCDGDPRTLEQRRADALGALAHGGDRLTCGCADADCGAARAPAPSSVVVNVVAEHARAAAGGQAGRHRDDPAGDPSRRQSTRTPLCALAGVGPICPVPGSDVPLPWLRRTRRPLRHRPHHRLSGGAHAGGESEMPVPKTPSAQNILGLVGSTTTRRNGHLDHPGRAHLHHPSG
jgi:hypothetical protein